MYKPIIYFKKVWFIFLELQQLIKRPMTPCDLPYIMGVFNTVVYLYSGLPFFFLLHQMTLRKELFRRLLAKYLLLMHDKKMHKDQNQS